MELNRLNDLYRDAILDHRRNPRNHDRLIDSDIVGDAINPFCGDEIHLQLGLDADYRVDCVGLQSVGCSINMAAGSMLTEAIHGKALDEIESLVLLFRQMMRGDVEAERLLKKEGDLSSPGRCTRLSGAYQVRSSVGVCADRRHSNLQVHYVIAAHLFRL